MNKVDELDETSPMTIQPDGLKTDLKPHQLTVLKAATDLETNRIHKIKIGIRTFTIHSDIGVLCDKVGSGKTLEILSIILNNKALTKYSCYDSRTITKEIRVSVDQGVSNTFLPANLVVVPHTIFKQWAAAIIQFTSLTTLDIFNSKTLRVFEEDTECGLGKDIILVSSTQYRKFYDIYEKYAETYERENSSKLVLSRVVFDEANMINIKRLYKIKASFYWFMTSSLSSMMYPYGKSFYRNGEGELNEWTGGPHRNLLEPPRPDICIRGIQNTGYIRDTFCRIHCHTDYRPYNEKYMEKYNKLIYIKNKDSFIENSFLLDPPNTTDIILENPAIYNMLADIVHKNVINMINAGDIDSAIESFNCNKTTSDNLITSVTESLEKRIHNLRVEKQMKESMIYSNEEQKTKTIEKLEVSIRDIQYKIQTLTERITQNDMCAVCYDSIKNKTLLDCCHNSFCFMCITTWLSQSTKCPYCRKTVTSSNITVVTETTPCAAKHNPSKLDKLKEILLKRREETPDTKFLIFSEYSSIFSKISPLLEELNIKFREVKGNINKTVRNYKNGDINCLLLNTTYFGNGLNLENTDDVIILHTLNKELNQQVIGRAQRPGRKTTLNIWNLKYRNEV